MTNYEIDTSKLGKSVRGLNQSKSEELKGELSPELVKNLERKNLEDPDPEIIYTVGEVGRIPTEELGLTYPEFKIDGDRFKEWRNYEGKFQREVAEDCGVDQKTISEIENEEHKVTPETAKKIVKGTGLSKEYLGLPEFVYDGEDYEKSEEVYNKIAGCLLGDGSLRWLKRKNNCFRLDGRDMRYTGYIQEELGKKGIFGNIYIEDDKHYKISKFQSKALPLFNKDQIYGDFYELDPEHPSSSERGYRKKIPEDLELNSTVVKLWYMGHGTLQKEERGNPHIEISAAIYSKEEIGILQEKLDQRGFKLNKPTKHKKYEGEDKGYIIKLSTESTSDFFEWIGRCPSIVENAVTNGRFNSSMKDKWL